MTNFDRNASAGRITKVSERDGSAAFEIIPGDAPKQEASPLQAFSIVATINERPRAHHLSTWLLGIIIFLAFGLASVAIVALPAMAISVSQLIAVAFSFALVAGGLLFTVWRFERGASRR
jgi:hypothetical protein